MEKVAFLIIPDFQQNGRTKNQSFDGVGNTGAYVIIHQLRKRGVDVGFCDFDSASQYDIVCISLTSSFDTLSLWRHLRFRRDWRRGARRFRVVCGGAGLKNPFPLLEWVDEFWFGRCDYEAFDFVMDPKYDHPSKMRWDSPRACIVNQVDRCFPEPVQTGKEVWRESFIGCPNKCGFCFYSWTRKNVQESEHFKYDLNKGRAMEIDIMNWALLKKETITPHVTVGLDGISERIRLAINKRITDDMLRELLDRFHFAAKDNYYLKIYNIAGYETETYSDAATLYSLIEEFGKKVTKKLFVELHTTPLSPEPATPLGYSAAPFFSRFNGLSGQSIFQDSKLYAFHSQFNGSSWQQFQQLCVQRFNKEAERILDLMFFSPKFKGLKNYEKMKYIEAKFDLADLLREYSTEERLPAWTIQSYMGEEKVKKVRESIRRKLYHV